MMSTLRLFVAIETPRDIKPHIAAIRDRLKASSADVRWEPDGKLHATLKFLGNANEDLLPDFVSYLEGVGRTASPLLVKYAGIGCFPNERAPKVIWIGMNDINSNLVSLQKEIDTGFGRFGFEQDERNYHPHVTIGRVKGTTRMDSLLRMIESITFESQPVEIREVALIKSELKPGGSVYSTLKTIPLGT